MRRIAGYGLCGLGLTITLALLAQSFGTAGIRGWDAITYLAAGERLNAGHDLYRLVPGDRWIWINPPYWSVPLLSPPPIAVLWRPLSALPNEWGLGLWWLACAAVIFAVIAGLARRLPIATGIALALVSFPLAWELGVANVNGLLLGGTVAAWILARRDRDGWAGAIIGLMAVVKLWPIVLLTWFVTQRRWNALRGVTVSVVAACLVSIACAGLDAHLQYLTIAGGTPPSLLSVAGLLAESGVRVPWIGYALLAFGVAEIRALRTRPAVAYSVAVVTMVLASPVVNINTYALLIASLAPFAWPLVPPVRLSQRAELDGAHAAVSGALAALSDGDSSGAPANDFQPP